MIRRPPRSTRTDTLFPYTTLFRSTRKGRKNRCRGYRYWFVPTTQITVTGGDARQLFVKLAGMIFPCLANVEQHLDDLPLDRSEERRVGKECVSTCRSRWSPNN